MMCHFLYLYDILFTQQAKIIWYFNFGGENNMRNGNGNAFWPFLAVCGAVTAAFLWFRNGNQINMPQWAKQPADQMGKTAQQIAGSFNPQG